jgi:hypothetical protein
MRARNLLVLLVAGIFVLAVSCKKKAEKPAAETSKIKAQMETVEKAESEESEAKEQGEKEEEAEVQEAKVDLSALPEAVLSAFKTAYPDAVIKGASQETEQGATYYEVESVEGTLHRDLLYAADGTAVEIEESMATTDMPTAVQETLAREYPEAKVLKSERLTKGDIVQYEMQLQVGEKTVELTIDPTGKIVEKPGE